MYKIELLPIFEDGEINIESEIIFENGTRLYFADRGSVIITDRSFSIKENGKGIDCITYFYETTYPDLE